jgi:hypothetical protein
MDLFSWAHCSTWASPEHSFVLGGVLFHLAFSSTLAYLFLLPYNAPRPLSIPLSCLSLICNTVRCDNSVAHNDWCVLRGVGVSDMSYARNCVQRGQSRYQDIPFATAEANDDIEAHTLCFCLSYLIGHLRQAA